MHTTRNMTLSAIFLALSLILPFFTGQIPAIGEMLLPMHIPVLLNGFLCGGLYGLLVGLLAPVLRSFLFGTPPLFPIAVAMSLELGTYGCIAGYLYSREKSANLISIYKCLLLAMLGGRLIYGIAMFVLLGLQGIPYTFSLFINSAFLSGIPGILLQLCLIPPVFLAVKKKN